MELKVFRETAAAYAGRWETRLELPVETEFLIPDYQPAVFKIVKCLLEPVVLQNHLSGTRWQGEGYLRCTVYYQSDEGGSQLYRTEQKFPFEKSAELPEGRYTEGPAQLGGQTEYLNCRAISEHRIELRGAYQLSVAAEAAKEQPVLTSLAEAGVEQRTAVLAGCLCTAAEERTATAEDTVDLPGAGESVLDISGSAVEGETSLQPGQISYRGKLRMQLCYRPAGGELAGRTRDIPVTMTMELPGALETDTPVVWVEVLSAALSAADAGDPVLNVTWKLHAELWRAANCTAVADAYSTLCQTQLDRVRWQYSGPARLIAETAAAAVSDDLPDTAAEVKGCFVSLGAPGLVADADGKTVRPGGKGTAHLLCADERGELSCCDKVFAWQADTRLPGPPEAYLAHLCAAAAEVHAGRQGNQMKVELGVNVSGAVFPLCRADTVDAVTLGDPLPSPSAGPALTLYFAQEGEAVFEIAKTHHARVREVAAANRMELAAGQSAADLKAKAGCLLIPAAL